MNTAPDSVDANGLAEGVAAFFTFGPGYTAGVYLLTILGVILMICAIAAWMATENRRLTVAAKGLAPRLAATSTIPTAPEGAGD